MDELNAGKILKDLLKKFDELKKDMSDDDLKLIREADDVIEFHFTLGMYIRNEWGLWSDSDLSRFFSKTRPPIHPDSISMILLEMFQQYLNGKEINLDGPFY